jgi:cyclopropane-fatty-acyl-phospholipid synthase
LWAARWIHARRRNSRAGSRRNISAHYDLGNDFFALFLDETMTYSSGIFVHPHRDLAQASLEKYDRICRKLQLSPHDRVMEVGCGWGGFALHAAREYGAHITATTISREQYRFASQRVAKAGLEDRIRLVMQDYRDLEGQFDKLVSIEMVEAVGDRYLAAYFRKCCDLLRPDGLMCLQAITIPDQRFDQYRRNVDFIQRYIFPGGFLPSFAAIAQAVKLATRFQWRHVEEFGLDYAETLRCWAARFRENREQARQAGFDETFLRMWDYYFAYCGGGFAERQVNVSQMVFEKV